MSLTIHNPAAIIRSVKRSRAELEAKAASVFSAYSHHGKKLIETGRELGEVLAELRDSCNAGEWLPLLEKLRIPRRTASRLIKKFKTPVEGRLGHLAQFPQDVEDELVAHLEAPEEAAEVAAEEVPPPPPKPTAAPSSNPAAGLLAPPKVQAIRCLRCTNTNKSGDDCTSCMEMRRPAVEKKSNVPEPNPERESGDESEAATALILCDRCQHVGAVKDCPQCAEARKAKGIDSHGRKGKPKRLKAPPKAEVRDALGNVVPDHLRDVFADTQLAEMIAAQEGIQAQFKPEPWIEKAGKLCEHFGFILIDKFRTHIFDSIARHQLATEALIAGLPYAVCPKCQGVDSNKNGETCRGCRGFGHVPKHRYEELTRA